MPALVLRDKTRYNTATAPTRSVLCRLLYRIQWPRSSVRSEADDRNLCNSTRSGGGEPLPPHAGALGRGRNAPRRKAARRAEPALPGHPGGRGVLERPVPRALYRLGRHPLSRSARPMRQAPSGDQRRPLGGRALCQPPVRAGGVDGHLHARLCQFPSRGGRDLRGRAGAGDGGPAGDRGGKPGAHRGHHEPRGRHPLHADKAAGRAAE